MELPLEHFTKNYSGIIFSTGNGDTLLASSSKDNTRVEFVKVEMNSYGYRVCG
jgi:hypothetical protein